MLDPVRSERKSMPATLASFPTWRSKTRDISIVDSIPPLPLLLAIEGFDSRSSQSVYTFFESDSRDWRISFKLSVERRIHDDSIGDVNGRFGMFVIIFFFFFYLIYISSAGRTFYFFPYTENLKKFLGFRLMKLKFLYFLVNDFRLNFRLSKFIEGITIFLNFRNYSRYIIVVKISLKLELIIYRVCDVERSNIV